MRLLFFGTPQFAVPTLVALVEAGHEICRVITQPARPVGRGRKLQNPPVAAWALERGLEVMQPTRIRGSAFLDELRGLEPDAAIVVAYGKIFRKSLLELPRLGCINLHGSLLPRHRGAAPIQAAILAGDRVTGVSTMQMSRGLDSGPVFLKAELEIGPEETSADLAPRLADLGAGLIVETLDRLSQGNLDAHQQLEEGVTYAAKIEKEEGRIDWNRSARKTFDRLRAYIPWPGSTSEFRDKPLKVLWARPVSERTTDQLPGTVLGADGDRIQVACGGGTVLALEQLQRPGKKPLTAREVWNGERWQAGERFTVLDSETQQVASDSAPTETS